jgi:adenylate cyclase
VNPLDPRFFSVQTGLAYAHFFAGRNDEASTWAATAIGQQPNYLAAQQITMACHAMSGRVEAAREICARLMQLKPTLRISRIKDRTPYRRAEDIDRLAQAYRIAGVPE